MNERLKAGYDNIDAREVLGRSPAILLGVTQSAADALKQVEIESVFDLATSRLFANASRILMAGLDPKDLYYRYGTPPNDVVNTGAVWLWEGSVSTRRAECRRILARQTQSRFPLLGCPI